MDRVVLLSFYGTITTIVVNTLWKKYLSSRIPSAICSHAWSKTVPLKRRATSRRIDPGVGQLPQASESPPVACLQLGLRVADNNVGGRTTIVVKTQWRLPCHYGRGRARSTPPLAPLMTRFWSGSKSERRTTLLVGVALTELAVSD
eukprot:COSAG05_NODE_1270_length_5316_cov_3.177688_5_plen_146_part_00